MYNVTLRINRGQDFYQGTDIPLQKDRIIIGRSSAAGYLDVHFSSPYISRKHAVIQRHKNGSFSIMDLQSKHGIEINGLKLEHNQPVPLNHKDSITLARGVVQLTFINHNEREWEQTSDFDLPMENQNKQQSFIINNEKRQVIIDGGIFTINGKKHGIVNLFI